MKSAKPSRASSRTGEIQELVERARRQGVTLDRTSANRLVQLGFPTAARRLDGVCRLMRIARSEDVELSSLHALRRMEVCGGNADEAIRRMLAGGVEAREGIPEAVEYAAERGVVLTPRSIYGLFKERGRDGTRRYIDKLAAILDAASLLGADCSQALASRRLSFADGDAKCVIADFAAEHRRRSDRRAVRCRVPIPPRARDARANAFAGCGCPRCRDRLADQLQHYIGKMIAASLFSGLDREEARAEANLELVRSMETWPGGNFTGWFAACFQNRVRTIYASRSLEEREATSLDAPGVLSDDEGGRIVSLGERIPDRTKDVLTIVLLRERFAEAALELRQDRAERGDEFTNGPSSGCPDTPDSIRLLSSKAPATEMAERGEWAGHDRKAA